MPIPPERVAIPRQHIDTFGVSRDGRIFASDRGHIIASTAISDVWAEARTLALTPAQVVSPLAGVPTTCATRRSRSGSMPEFRRPKSPSGLVTASKSCSASTPSA